MSLVVTSRQQPNCSARLRSLLYDYQIIAEATLVAAIDHVLTEQRVEGLLRIVQCPRTFYTDLDTLICKTLPQGDLLGEQHTSRRCHPAIAGHAPHRTGKRQRP